MTGHPTLAALSRLRRDPTAVLGLAVLGVVLVTAACAPLLAWATGHPVGQQYRVAGLTPEGLPVGPSREFLLGTDDLGRDLLVRLAYGARTSLAVTVLATAISTTVGVFVGLVAGAFGGLVDTVLARLVDTFLALPFVLAALAVISVTGPGLTVTVAVLGLSTWVGVARYVRAQVLSTRELGFVEAARSLGAGRLRLMLRHLLPNAISPILVHVSLLAPVVLLGEATLAYLGLGLDPRVPDWGQMISSGQRYYATAWWVVLFPSMAVAVCTLALTLVADAVHDTLSPGSRAHPGR